MANNYKLRIIVNELANVYNEYGTTNARIRIYISTTGLEADRALHDTIPLDPDTSTYYYDTTGTDTYVAWYTYYNVATTDESNFSGPIKFGTADQWYVSIEDVRAEGITEAMADDDRVIYLIRLAQTSIDRATGRHFNPVYKTIKIDSEPGAIIEVPEPIVYIESLTLEELAGAGLEPTEVEYSVDLMRVYNRHLTQALLCPDDREWPRIVITPEYFPTPRWEGAFCKTRQQMKIVGVFGYTDLRPGDTVGETSAGSQVPLSYGRTPLPIVEVTKRLIRRWVHTLGADADLRRADEMAGKVKSWKTDEQSITFGTAEDLDHGIQWITGDLEIDSVLGFYSAHNRLSMSAISKRMRKGI